METVPEVDRVEAVLAELTFEEKLTLIRGGPDPDGKATGYIDGVERVGLPPLRMVDGPMGIRTGKSTAFPATIGLGATWDAELAERMGAAVAREARAKGQDVLLGPGINIIRVPLSGRNFEFVSEDPLLSGELGAGYVEGVEREDVVATPKHFVANNQEIKRSTIDVDVDERTLRELYLAPFRRVVEESPGATMAAYNQVQGTHMTAHERLLSDVLEEEWGFDGVTVSDWWATHDAAGALSAGLDVEMPGVNVIEWLAPSHWAARTVRNLGVSRHLGIDPPLIQRFFDRFLARPGQPNPFGTGLFGDPLRSAIENGEVSRERLDDAVRAVLGTYERLGILEGGRDPIDGFDRSAHGELAREVATRGTVILKNDGTLPLAGDSIAVVGPNADQAKVGGGGSSSVAASASTSILEGIRERVPGRVTHEPGLEPIAGHWPPGIPLEGRLLPRFGFGPSFEAAVDAAADADVAVVVVQDAATEGEDRASMSLPGDQDRLVAAVAAANDRTVVVAQTSAPIEMPWIDDVAAAVECWYPGQAGGVAVADVLFGTDPGGRLPVTFGEAFADYPVADQRRYPGVDGTVHYDEGLSVGYRHFDESGVTPLFPFGHGHSYAEFEYEDVTAARTDDGANLSVTLANVADRRGREVIQAYAAPPEGPVDRPARELVAFESVSLGPGERRRVDLAVREHDLARYDADGAEWTVDPGEYEFAVGRSSRDRRLRATVEW